MPELLEFEEPIGVLLKEIEALSMLPQTPDRLRSIETLRRRAEEIRGGAKGSQSSPRSAAACGRAGRSPCNFPGADTS